MDTSHYYPYLFENDKKRFFVNAEDMDREAVVELLLLILKVIPDYIEKIKSYIYDNKLLELQAISHKYKGTMSVFMDQELFDAVKILNDLAKIGDWEKIENSVHSLYSLTDRFLYHTNDFYKRITNKEE